MQFAHNGSNKGSIPFGLNKSYHYNNYFIN